MASAVGRDRVGRLIAGGVPLDVHIPARQELAGDSVGLVHEAARVAAKVEDQPIGTGLADLGQDALELVGRALRELLQAEHGSLRSCDHRPGHGLHGDLRPNDAELALRSICATADPEDDRGSGLTADPAGNFGDVVAVGRPPIDRHDEVAGLEFGQLGRTRVEDAYDQRPPVRGGIDPDADPDIRAGQLLGSIRAFLRREERRMPGVADRVRQALDRPVCQGLVVELVGADVVFVEDFPGLSDQAEGVV